MKYLLTGLIAATLISTTSFASMHIEPILGYKYGVSIEYGTDPLFFPLDQQGLLYGAKFTYSFENFFVGLEYAASNYDSTWDLVAPIPDVVYDTKQSQAGLVFGYGSTLRLWFSYFLDARQEWNSNAAESKKGTGFGLGVGYKVLDYLSLNLEGQLFNYTKDFNGNKIDSFKPIDLVLSASFPIQIL